MRTTHSLSAVVRGPDPATLDYERKRLAVINWFARKFEPGRRYPELEVNAIIAEFINDFASVRRYLVDYRIMDRQAGVYWRVDTAE